MDGIRTVGQFKLSSSSPSVEELAPGNKELVTSLMSRHFTVGAGFGRCSKLQCRSSVKVTQRWVLPTIQSLAEASEYITSLSSEPYKCIRCISSRLGCIRIIIFRNSILELYFKFTQIHQVSNSPGVLRPSEIHQQICQG